jgi:hypothetical protein
MNVKNKKEIKDRPIVLFYVGNTFGFRSLPIWHVFEVAQVYPVILLSDELDSETEKILREKNFFPKLKEIILIKHASNSLDLMIENNKALYKTAKDVILQYKPDVVVSGGVVYPFPLYLRRIARRKGILNISTFSPRIFSSKEIGTWVTLSSAYLKKIRLLPFFIILFWEKLRKQLGHFLYYWVLPITVGELPFRKEPGCILFGNLTGKSSDYYISFSKRDFNLALSEGMPLGKLYNLSNPYPPAYVKIRKFLKKRFILNNKEKIRDKKKILTIMWPHSQIGIKKEDFSFIPENEIKKKRIRIIGLICGVLKDWKVFIKPHPEAKVQECLDVKKSFETISDNIEVVDRSEWADAYTEISDVVIGLPPTSITLYTASIICPEKPILSLDFDGDLLGDGYKNFPGVEYINKEKKLIDVLRKVRDGKYHKNFQKKEHPKDKNFPSFIELLDFLFNKKIFKDDQ